MAITISGDSPNLTSASLTTPTLTSPTFAGTPSGSIITSMTAQASTSGTSIDFTSIPSWVKRVTVMFNGVSTNGTSNVQVQLGDSGGVEITGYTSRAAPTAGSGTTSTTGVLVISTIAAADILNGMATFSLFDSATNTWVASTSLLATSTSAQFVGSAIKSLSATLDRVRITTVNGTDTFDAGTINILYE